MNTDLSDHPFSPENVRRECGNDPDLRVWLRWVGRVEAILGHDLDGDEFVNGFSIDFASDAYDLGRTPEEYAAAVRANPIYDPADLLPGDVS